MTRQVFVHRRMPYGRIALFSILALAVGVALLQHMGLQPDQLIANMLRLGRERPTALIEPGLYAALVLFGLPWLSRMEAKAFVALDGPSIELRSGLPAWMGRLLRRDWKVDTTTVHSVTLSRHPMHRNRMMLSLATDSGQVHTLEPEHWIAQQGPTAESASLRLRPYTVEELTTALTRLPLLRAMTARGINVRVGVSAPAARPATNLWKHPAAIGVCGLMAITFLYGLVDGFFIRAHEYAEAWPWALWIGIGCAMALLAERLLKRDHIPLRERMVLALMTGAACGLAADPGLQRINAATDPLGPRAYIYRFEQGGVLRPASSDVPMIRPPAHAPYWQRQTPGSEHTVLLYRGVLDYWQYACGPPLDRSESVCSR